MIRTPRAGGPVIRHRWRQAAATGLCAVTIAACTTQEQAPQADSLTVPAIAVPVSDSAADSVARQAEERSSVNPPAGSPTPARDAPLIRPARPDTGAARPSAQRAPAGNLQGMAIRLERTACLGSCPVYSVALRGDGSVRYEGKEHVRRTGSADTTVATAAVRGIIDAATSAGFFSLADRYAYGEPTCPLYTADSPRTFITISTGTRTKRVEHDYGCENGPQALVALASRIDSVAGVTRWTGPRH